MFKPIDTCLLCKSTAAHSLVLFKHLIRFSCVAKHRISIGKKSNLLHSNDRWLKDINRKKNQGKTIDRVHLFQENLMVAKIARTDCYIRYKKARRFCWSYSFNYSFDCFSRIRLFMSRFFTDIEETVLFVESAARHKTSLAIKRKLWLVPIFSILHFLLAFQRNTFWKKNS